MVQFVTGYPSRSSMIGKILGESLGEGLGNFIGHHFANKDLEGLLADKELAKLPLAERLSKMESVLGRHGKRGQNLLARRLELEQLAEQEKSQQLQSRTAKEEVKTLSKILSGEDVSKEEFESLSPKTQLEVLKIKNKPPAGGVSAQPVPPQVQQTISNVLKENQGSNADQLALAMDEAGVPRAFSNSYIESRRRADESDLKTFEKASDYQDQILSDYSSYRRDSDVLSQMEQLAEKGNLPNPLLVSALDSVGFPIGALKNPDAEQFQKLSQELVKNISGTYGNRILKVEVDNFLKSIPTLLNSDEGKKRLIRQWQIINEGKKAKYEAYREVERENPKKLPQNFKFLIQDKADEKLDRLSEEFRSIGINSNRVKVPKGTPISSSLIEKYLDLANEDIELAKKMAREDGYEF